VGQGQHDVLNPCSYVLKQHIPQDTGISLWEISFTHFDPNLDPDPDPYPGPKPDPNLVCV